MKLVASGLQQIRHFLYDASGAIAVGGTPQVVLGQSQSRSHLFIQNLSTTLISVEFGSARATATLTSGKVTSCTVTNAGFNFTKPPVIEFLGGGNPGNSSYLGLNQPGGPAPSAPARAHAVLTAGAVSSIVIDDGGAGYIIAPYVMIRNSDLDPYGCAIPTATSGILLPAQGNSIIYNGTVCPTDSVGIFGASTQGYCVRWMD